MRTLSTPPALLLILLSTALLPLGPSAEAQSERFGERADVVLVQIPVHVTRDGEPVRDLTAKNFRVFEGRKKLPVVGLDVHDLAEVPGGSEAPVAASVPPAGRRYFVLLFDLSNSLPSGIMRAREAAYGMATRRLHPSDLVAVATYSESRGVDIVMNFSTDRAQLLTALDDLGLVDPFESLQDPLRLFLAEGEEGFRDISAGSNVPGPGPGMSGMFSTFVYPHLIDMSNLKTRANRDQAKQQIFDLSTNLDQLARLLDTVSGRKQIVLFSQGFDSEIVFGTRDTARLERMAREVDQGFIWRVDSEERFGASDTQLGLLTMLEQFNRSDAAIHTVDVGGLVAAGEARAAGESFDNQPLDRGHDGLFLIANETGGEFYRNFNDLGAAMEDLLERTSVTYVISVQPPELALDGSYHPIEIELEGVGKGVKISHRPGYYARRAFWELPPAERQLANTELLVAGRSGGAIATDLLAVPFPDGAGSADVLTAIEIDGSSLIAGQPDNIVPTEIYAYAFDTDGQIRDFFTQAVTLDLFKVGYRLETGLKLLGHLQLPPGDYQIRSLVRNARTGDTGLAVADIRVPDFGAAEPQLLPPLFIDAEDRWLVGHAASDGEEGASYPLMGPRGPLVPASKPRLVTEKKIPLLLVAHDLPPAMEATGHLIGPDGRVHEGVQIAIDHRLGDPGLGEHLMAHLRVSDVQPGDYRLVVSLQGDGQEVASSLAVSLLRSP